MPPSLITPAQADFWDSVYYIVAPGAEFHAYMFGSDGALDDVRTSTLPDFGFIFADTIRLLH